MSLADYVRERPAAGLELKLTAKRLCEKRASVQFEASMSGGRISFPLNKLKLPFNRLKSPFLKTVGAASIATGAYSADVGAHHGPVVRMAAAIKNIGKNSVPLGEVAEVRNRNRMTALKKSTLSSDLQNQPPLPPKKW